jgi:hypothetical protein
VRSENLGSNSERRGIPPEIVIVAAVAIVAIAAVVVYCFVRLRKQVKVDEFHDSSSR